MNAPLTDIGQIPMSPALAATLARASDAAASRRLSQVTLEHMLLGLCDDPDAQAVLNASRIDILRLRWEVARFVDAYAGPSHQGSPVEQLTVADDLSRILEAAGAAARGGRRRDIDGAIVLAAIVGDGQSHAAKILESYGLTFDAAIRALQQAMAQRPPPPPAPVPRATEDVLARARERIQTRTAPTLSDLLPRQQVAPPSSRPPEAEADHGVQDDDNGRTDAQPAEDVSEPTTAPPSVADAAPFDLADAPTVPLDFQRSSSRDPGAESRSADKNAPRPSVEADDTEVVTADDRTASASADPAQHAEADGVPRLPPLPDWPPVTTSAVEDQQAAVPDEPEPPRQMPRLTDSNKPPAATVAPSPKHGAEIENRPSDDMATGKPAAPAMRDSAAEQPTRVIQPPPPPPPLPQMTAASAPSSRLPPGFNPALYLASSDTKIGEPSWSNHAPEVGAASLAASSQPPPSPVTQPPTPGLQRHEPVPRLPDLPDGKRPEPGARARVPFATDEEVTGGRPAPSFDPQRGPPPGPMPMPPSHNLGAPRTAPPTGARPPSTSPGAAAPRTPRPIPVGKLLTAMPRKMRIRRSKPVRIRIPTGAVRDLLRPYQGRTPGNPYGIAVRLFAPDGGIHVKKQGETIHWLGSGALDANDADQVSWHYTAIPYERGQIPVTLSIRIVAPGPNGVMSENVIGEDTMYVHVRGNIRRGVSKVFGWCLAFAIGIAVGRKVDGLWAALHTAAPTFFPPPPQ